MKITKENSGLGLRDVSDMLNSGQLSSARVACQKICNKDRLNADAWTMLGVIHASMGNYKEAIKCFRKSIALNPRDALIHYNLGLALLKTNAHTTSVSEFRRALECNSNFTEARYNLAIALQQSGDFKEAESAYLDVLRSCPSMTNAYVRLSMLYMGTNRVEDALNACQDAIDHSDNLANANSQMGKILHLTGKHEQAITYFQKSIELDSDLIESYIGLADAYLSIGNLEKAAAYYRHAEKQRPGDPAILKKLGYTYQNIGRVIDAVLCFEKALENTSNDSELLFNYGNSLELVGREEEALHVYEKSISIDPDLINSIAGKAHILEKRGLFYEAFELVKPIVASGRYSFYIALVYADLLSQLSRKNDAIDYLESYLEMFPLDSQNSLIHYRLGKLLDSMGQYDRAFEHIVSANTITPYHYDYRNQVNFVDKCLHGFTKDMLREMPRSSVSGKKLIFIVGMPRSGTSLTEQILASNSMVYGAGELTDIEQIYNEMAARLTGISKRPFPESLRDASTLIAEYSQRYHSKIMGESGSATHVTDKMPHNFRFLGLIELLFPDARIIHCTRNAVDTCLSIYFQPFTSAHSYARDLHDLGKYYCEYRRLMTHWKETISLPLFEVQYESLVSNEEKYIKDMLDFCSLPLEQSCFTFHETPRYVRTPSYDQVRQPMYSRSVMRWKKYESHLAKLLAALGEYAES